jgi:hypothetical protein
MYSVSLRTRLKNVYSVGVQVSAIIHTDKFHLRSSQFASIPHHFLDHQQALTSKASQKHRFQHVIDFHIIAVLDRNFVLTVRHGSLMLSGFLHCMLDGRRFYLNHWIRIKLIFEHIQKRALSAHGHWLLATRSGTYIDEWVHLGKKSHFSECDSVVITSPLVFWVWRSILRFVYSRTSLRVTFSILQVL